MLAKTDKSPLFGAWIAIILPVIFLTSLSLLILLSAGAGDAENPYSIVGKQAMWLCVALVAGLVCSFVDLKFLKQIAIPLAAVSIILLVLVLIPGISREINGSRRWISFGQISLQASDFAKPVMVVLLSSYLYNNQRRIKTFVHGLIKPLMIVGTFCVLIIAEPDYGTTFLFAAVGFLLIFLAGAKIAQIALLGTPLVALFCLLVYLDPVRIRRVISFLDIEGSKSGDAYQLYQAILAFGSGKITGAGIGQGRQQLAYLPEAHTDFVFAIVGEELGMICTMSVVFAFFVLFATSVFSLKKAPNLYEFCIGAGAMFMIILQALINMGVVTGLLPTKGISMPFISYGGSNLVVMFAFTGLLVNCVRSWNRPTQIIASEL